MPQKLTPEQHAQKREEAYALSINGWQSPAIGQELGVHYQTVKSLLKEARALRRKERDALDPGDDLRTFLGEQDWVVRQAIERLQDTGNQSLNVGALLNTISNASEKKGKALGLFKDRHEIVGDKNAPVVVKHEHNFDFGAYQRVYTQYLEPNGLRLVAEDDPPQSVDSGVA